MDYIILLIGVIVICLISYLISKWIWSYVPDESRSERKLIITSFIGVSITLAITLFGSMLLFLLSPMSMKIPAGSRIDGLVKGKVAYSVPDTMEIEKNYRGTVSISKALNDSILFQDLDSTQFDDEEIKISSRVKVILMDPTGNKNFDIVALNTEEQLVDEISNTVWMWNITPVKAGNNELVIRATVKILDGLGENYKDIRVFERRIKVNASLVVITKQFVVDYWQFLSTAIFIPLIVWGYKKFNERKKDSDVSRPIGFKRKDDNKTHGT